MKLAAIVVRISQLIPTSLFSRMATYGTRAKSIEYVYSNDLCIYVFLYILAGNPALRAGNSWVQELKVLFGKGGTCIYIAGNTD
jgi:hypothetical protein